ncbi:MAG TPA: hypothetical protein VH880_06740, partial [Anaeromyxobacteraceae bacterium]
KCGDDLHRKAKGSYWVTWVVPVPRGARVRSEDEPPIRRTRPPGDASTDFADRRQAVDEFDVEWWERDHAVQHDPAGRRLLGDYLAGGRYEASLRLVEHPAVKDPEAYKLCSCVRHDIVVRHDGAVERIHIQSRFRSSRADGSGAVEFRPSPLVIEFSRPGEVWIPLRFAELVSGTSVTVDIYVPDGRTLGPVPAGFTALLGKQADPVDGTPRQWLRLSATLPPGPTPDLAIPLN